MKAAARAGVVRCDLGGPQQFVSARSLRRSRPIHTNCSSSTEPNALFKVPESRVGAERIETRPQEDAGVESLFVALLEPGYRLIVVAERCIDDGNLRRIRIGRARALLQ